MFRSLLFRKPRSRHDSQSRLSQLLQRFYTKRRHRRASVRRDLCLEFGEVGYERSHYTRIIMGAASTNEQIDCLFTGQAFTILPVFSNGIKTIHHREYSCGKWNLLAFESVWITVSIPAFMMMPNDGNNRIRKLDAPENLGAG